MVNSDTPPGSTTMMRLLAKLGLVFIVVAVLLMFWREHSAVRTAKSLEEGAGSVVTADAKKVDSANEGKLVYVSGEPTSPESVTDPDFGISAKALQLNRKVEVYQWVEHKNETKSGKKTKVTYTYSREWSDKTPKTSFQESDGHKNPDSKPYENKTISASNVSLGAFKLTPEQVGKLSADETLSVTPEMIKGASKPGLEVDSGMLFVPAAAGHKPEAPEVGDVRIQYKVAQPKTVSVVAQQSGNSFKAYTAKEGDTVDLIQAGNVDHKKMFEKAQGTSDAVGWFLRVVCVFFLLLGVNWILKRKAADAGYDISGFLTKISIGFLSLIGAISIMLTVVGLRWAIYQPSHGGIKLLIGLVGLAAVFFGSKKFSQPSPAVASKS